MRTTSLRLIVSIFLFADTANQVSNAVRSRPSGVCSIRHFRFGTPLVVAEDLQEVVVKCK